MKVINYPDSSDIEETTGPLSRFYKDLKRNYPKLWSLVRETLEKVERSSNLNDLERQGWVERLPHLNVPIYEFRIPPTKKGGVARLYFGYLKKTSSTIMILSAEIKQGKSKANEDKIKQAVQRFKEKCI